MADFVKLDGYNVKDALAGKSLSISGDQLSLLKADGTAASTVTIPKGMKVYRVNLQYKDTVTDQTQYPSILDAVALGQGSWSVFSITEVLTGTSVATTTKLEDLMTDGLVYITASILFTAQGTNTWYTLDTHNFDGNSRIALTISNGVPLYVQGWITVSINAHTNAVSTTSVTKISGGGSSTLAGLSDVDVTGVTDGQILTYDSNSGEWVPTTPSSGGGSSKTNIIAEVDSMDWTNISRSLNGIPANDNFGIGILDFQTQNLSTSVKQLAMSITSALNPFLFYASFEDYIADVVQASTGFALTSWYVYNQNTIYKATANCTLNTGTMTFDILNFSINTTSAIGV